MENKTKRGGKRIGAGRPKGARSTGESTFVSRLRKKSGLAQADLAAILGVREKTVWRYEKEGIVPSKGRTRAELEKLAEQYGEAIESDSTRGRLLYQRARSEAKRKEQTTA